MKSDYGLRTFADSVAIVTGGGRGIGQALCSELASRGANVCIADLDMDLARQTADSIQARGGQATAAQLDVSDSEAFANLARETKQRTGRIDYLFNNAGICIFGDVRAHAVPDWQRLLDVNLGGVVNGIHAAYPIMLDQGFGHLVNTASLAGLVPVPWATSYTASKFAVVGLSNALRVEAAEVGIRVTVLCPGVVKTPVLEDGGNFGKFVEPVSPQRRKELWRGTSPMPVEQFAIKALRGVAKNHEMVVVPAFSRFIWNVNCFCPPLGRYLTRQMYRSRKQVVNTTERALEP